MIVITGRIISKKNAKRIIRAGGRQFIISSKAYLKFEKEAVSQIKSQKHTTYKGNVDVCYTLTYKGKMWIDADNAIASLNDILQKAEVLEDDKQVKSGTFYVQSGKDWRAEIEISPIS